MPDAIWIDEQAEVQSLAERLAGHASIAVDTEFLREKTFFPRLCLVQIAAGADIWCVDAIRAPLDPLVPALTAVGTRKLIHAARQDLEALHLATKRVVTPVFDTQVAAGCVGFKPQTGYAELVHGLLGVSLEKAHTRADWSKRPLSAAQVAYAADDVRYLEEVARLLTEKLHALGRENWALEDCAALEDVRLFEPDPARAWERVRGINQLDAPCRARAKALAVWRERIARERDLPRSWVLSDAAIFEIAHTNPATPAALAGLREIPPNYNARFAAALLDALQDPAATSPDGGEPRPEARPTDAEKALINRLNTIVDRRAAELAISAELLAPRGQIKALALGRRDVGALQGWRRAEIGERLLAAVD
ncbi:MAG: ribonuclease D [Gammaproteobacteria bacterium]|nr:ribonuclease D [Gammaproteobacteria bacterium]